LYSPHWEHFTKTGASSRQVLARRLSRLAFDVFLFGTAMSRTSFKITDRICESRSTV